MGRAWHPSPNLTPGGRLEAHRTCLALADGSSDGCSDPMMGRPGSNQREERVEDDAL